MRSRGSCRLDPYWKVQLFDAEALAWVDIQKQHHSEKEARKSAPVGRKFRLVHVTEAGRHFGLPDTK